MFFDYEGMFLFVSYDCDFLDWIVYLIIVFEKEG